MQTPKIKNPARFFSLPKNLVTAFTWTLLGAAFCLGDEALALAANEDAKDPPAAIATPAPIPTPAADPAVVATPAAPQTISGTPASVSDATDKAATEARRTEINAKVRNPTLRSHLMENIDVFGKNDLPAIYILGPGLEEFEGQILTRDFARDPFFMQNVDREEFEMKMWMHGDLESDSKKKEELKK
jgi:hypothetical protein